MIFTNFNQQAPMSEQQKIQSILKEIEEIEYFLQSTHNLIGTQVKETAQNLEA